MRIVRGNGEPRLMQPATGRDVTKALLVVAVAGIGDFLAEKVCPATPEEELLKEMWGAATPEARKTIAGLMVKMSE